MQEKDCKNCQHMQSNLGRNPNDTFFCNRLKKMVHILTTRECEYWEKREPLDSLSEFI